MQKTTFINTFSLFSEQIRLAVSSARKRIHMKNQALFSSKDESKNIKCRLLQYLFGALRVKLKMRVCVYLKKQVKTLFKYSNLLLCMKVNFEIRKHCSVAESD